MRIRRMPSIPDPASNIPTKNGEGWPDTDHPALSSLRTGSPQEKAATLPRLFAAYLPPLRHYIRHHWPLLSESDIDDLASEFLTLCLTGEKAHFLTYDQQRNGAPVRLRTYLRFILDNFLRNQRRGKLAHIRGGNRQFESLDTIQPAPHQESPAGGAPARPGVDTEAYDRHWAQHILSVSFSCLEKGSPATREWLPILRPWILADPGDASLKEIAREQACTHAAVRAQLHRLRKAWRQAVRDAVSRTVSHPEDIDDELRHLAAVLARHPMD
jgi:DNA-directed RNA polymerase specialized sigma24 family protein